MADRLTIGLLERARLCHTHADRAALKLGSDAGVVLLGIAEGTFWATLAVVATQPNLCVEVSATLSEMLAEAEGRDA